MLSSALSQVLERARTRFGLDVEIFDDELRNLYPEGPTDLGRAVKDSTELRQSLRAVAQMGHPREIEAGGRRYRVYPLQNSERTGQKSGLLAVRGQDAEQTEGTAESGPWPEFARAAIEADLSATDRLREERQSSRRLLAVLRFLKYLLESNDEAGLTQALVQAAAVWFDVDARIYRRDLEGRFHLHNWLPAAEPDDASRRLDVQLLGTDRDIKRLPSSPEFGNLAAGGDLVVVPLAGAARAEWILTLSGAVPQDADSIFEVVARVVGVQLEALHTRRMAEARRRFETIVRQMGVAPERIALQLVNDLVHEAGAGSASVTLVGGSGSRRVAALGPPSGDDPAQGDTWVMTPERFVCGLALAPGQWAVLELRPRAGESLSAEAADMTTTCAHVVQTWLVGAVSSFSDPTDGEPAAPGFEKRIEEELERAKRFDLHLSLVLVDVVAPTQAFAQIQEALRRELRGSDLLGTTSGRQLAALLTHTDDRGLDNVVMRLRRRLADAADRLQISDVRLGQAALSPDCRTADALLSRAVRGAEPIVVH